MDANAPGPTSVSPPPPPPHSPAASRVEMNEIVLPTNANAMGTAFGGAIMSWVDICGGMAAQRHARAVCVTASMDAVDFLAPIKVGFIVNLKAMVNFVGRTSMEVGVRVEAENPLTGERVHAASAYLTFVAIDAEGRPRPVPPLVPHTPEEQLRCDEAAARRRQRLALAFERRSLREQHAQAAGGAGDPTTRRRGSRPG